MGGWIALLLARRLQAAGKAERLAGMVLIAPAADFTERLMWNAFPQDVKDTIERDGVWLRPSPYGEDPYPASYTHPRAHATGLAPVWRLLL